LQTSIETKIIRALGESTGAILFIALLSGLMTAVLRFITYNVLKSIGIDYFKEINESYKWIGQLLIESRAIMNSDRTCFYRCMNGKFYIENGKEANKDIEINAIVNIVKNKSINKLPENLNPKYLDLFNELQKYDEYLELFSQDLPLHSALRNELSKYNIIAYMGVKIKFDNNLYGVIIFTWSTVKDIPKNLLLKNKEYLDDLKNSILIETIFIISRSFKFWLQEKIKWK